MVVYDSKIKSLVCGDIKLHDIGFTFFFFYIDDGANFWGVDLRIN